MIGVWPQVRIEKVEAPPLDAVTVGRDLVIAAQIHLNGLAPDDVEAQIFHGIVDSRGSIAEPYTAAMKPDGGHQGLYTFRGTLRCSLSGQYGFAVRVMPRHPHLGSVLSTGLIVWS